MNPQSETRALFLRYMLQEMTAEERERVEGALLDDGEFFASFQDAEYDLLDAYAAGELPTSDRELVEQLLQRNSAMAEKARLCLTRRASLQAAPLAAAIRRERSFGWRRPALAFAAMLAIVFVSVGYFAWYRPMMRVGKSIGAQPAGTPPPVSSRAKPAAASTLALLLPATSRSSGAELSIALTPTVDTVDIQWVVPEEIASETRFELRASSGSRLVATTQSGSLEHASGQVVAHFALPAGKLVDGHYLFQVVSIDHQTPETEAAVQVKRVP